VTVPAPVRPPAVYVTSPFASWIRVGDEVRHQPASVVHAKRAGTTTTLCGRPASSWPKFWSLDFVRVDGVRCRACVDRLADPA